MDTPNSQLYAIELQAFNRRNIMQNNVHVPRGYIMQLQFRKLFEKVQVTKSSLITATLNSALVRYAINRSEKLLAHLARQTCKGCDLL